MELLIGGERIWPMSLAVSTQYRVVINGHTNRLMSGHLATANNTLCIALRD